MKIQEGATILVAEDDKGMVNLMTTILSGSHYRTLAALTGAEAITLAASHNPDLILLDLGLPDMDGLEVLVSIREWSEIPVIVVTARQAESEKIKLLDAGANDYITKPFGTGELLARIRAALRQQEKLTHWHKRASSIEVGNLKIDYAGRRIMLAGSDVHMTPIEYKILILLSKNAGRVLTHDFIIRNVWGPFASDSQVLRVNMANIRRKIEDDPSKPKYLLTEVGVGYMFAGN